MKWTLDWLLEYLKTDLSADEIADVLTKTGLEVDDVFAPIAPVAAKIVECAPVEGSDHLHVLKVDDGAPDLRQVVCGAPNARVGLVSALARPGCIVAGHKIESGKLRGVVSNGMMCSERELGIGENHDGIMELPADTPLGAPVLDVDTVFDAGITPNRPDYLAVRGIARDLMAVGAGQYIAPMDSEISDVPTARRVIVETEKCPIYRFCEIADIKMAPSDKKIARRLAAIGINPKNAPIDATNYICYDMAQPMHCFDADEIQGDIIVRMAKDGEEFTDLFGATHALCDTDIVIADNAGILALAGVIGGARGATTDKTKNIILESAYFDSVCVRKTSKRIGVSTDASYRYERGIDPTISGVAIAAAARIIMDACGGKIVGTGIGGAGVKDAPQIEYSPDLFMKKTGIDMPAMHQRQILENLGFVVRESGEKWIVTPRAARVDVQIPETIVAELMRIYGYDKISGAKSTICTEPRQHDMHEMMIKTQLAARGINECKSFGFGNSATEVALFDRTPLKIANPITSDLDTMRGDLLGNLLVAVANNEKRGYPDLSLFELGTVFTGFNPGEQKTSLTIVRTGATGPKHWSGRARAYDIYDVKADLIALMQGQRFTVDASNPPRWAHPFRYGAIYQGKKKIAQFGELSPVVAKKLRIKTNVVVAIVDDIANLPGIRRPKNTVLSEFQPITRDFAFITDADAQAEKIVAAAASADARITNVVVFDAFNMGDGKKSIAFTITVQPTANMSDEDLSALQNAVISRVESKCGAKIRDK